VTPQNRPAAVPRYHVGVYHTVFLFTQIGAEPCDAEACDDEIVVSRHFAGRHCPDPLSWAAGKGRLATVNQK